MTDPAAQTPTTGDADAGSFGDRLNAAMDARANGDVSDADPNGGAPLADDAAPADGEALFDAASAVTPEAAAGADGALAAVQAERDEYLDALQRLKAEFDNHKRRNAEQAVQQREQAAASLVEKLLPVLDACEAALVHDAEAVRPVSDQLLEALGASGLAVVSPTGELFDPEEHEAVMHEEGDGAEDGPVVAEVLRTGYSWNGRVLRPAMVKVRG